jgi:hypothetical protein
VCALPKKTEQRNAVTINPACAKISILNKLRETRASTAATDAHAQKPRTIVAVVTDAGRSLLFTACGGGIILLSRPSAVAASATAFERMAEICSL